MKFTRAGFKKLLPSSLLTLYRRVKVARRRRRQRGQTVKEVFTQIYADNVWGGRPNEYVSGQGSNQLHAAQYAEMARRFISHKGLTTVVDLGCGDFVVGRRLQMEGVNYVGVDIVDELIAHNQREFGGPQTRFLCLDIIADELPPGELCLIRQVLQHLSNAQILAILQKVTAYPYVLITEHYPAPRAKTIPNKDKPAGGDIRTLDHSAVYLDQPPFNLTPVALLLEVEVDQNNLPGETLRTFLVEHPPSGSVKSC